MAFGVSGVSGNPAARVAGGMGRGRGLAPVQTQPPPTEDWIVSATVCSRSIATTERVRVS